MGLYLESPCFSHGQLYVGSSRVGSARNVFIVVNNGKTRNIVFPQHCINPYFNQGRHTWYGWYGERRTTFLTVHNNFLYFMEDIGTFTNIFFKFQFSFFFSLLIYIYFLSIKFLLCTCTSSYTTLYVCCGEIL